MHLPRSDSTGGPEEAVERKGEGGILEKPDSKNAIDKNPDRDFRSDGDAVRGTIRRASGRSGLINLALALCVLIPAALAVMIVESVLVQFRPIGSNGLLLINGIMAALGIALLLWLTFRRTGSHHTAERIDLRKGLRDRVSSALEFGALKSPSPMHKAQLRDARNAVAGLDPAEVFPLDRRRALVRLVPVLVLVPLLVLVQQVDLKALFPEKTAQQSATGAPPLPEEGEVPGLEEALPDSEILQLVRPAEELIRQWKQRLAAIQDARRKQEAEAPSEQPAPPEEPRPKMVKTVTVSKGSKEARTIEAALENQRISISDLAMLADKELDGDYAEAFEYLDAKAFEKSAGLIEVKNMAESMNENAKKRGIGGDSEIVQSQMGSTEGLNMGAENDPQGAFRNQTQGAMQESFSEFLKEYAAHLARLAGKMEEIVKSAYGKQDSDKQPKAIIPGEIPPDAKFQLADNDKDMEDKYGLTQRMLVDKPPEGVELKPGLARTSQAGRGAGTPEGAFKTPKVEASPTQYMEIESTLGEGVSPIQIIEDFGAQQDQAAAFQQVFRDYAMNAERLLDMENLPVSIENYVRAYFLALSPDQSSSDEE